MNGPKPVRDLRLEEKSWDSGRRGDVSLATYRRNYLQTLYFVLEYVEILLTNINAERVAITADHGEALGENGVYGHPFAHPFTPVKTVPWTITSATDEHTYSAKYDRIDQPQSEQEQREFLAQMGYL
jgi:glucan phosphoethanolaminetransferase (alkaline phosphatase superfamily)